MIDGDADDALLDDEESQDWQEEEDVEGIGKYNAKNSLVRQAEEYMLA